MSEFQIELVGLWKNAFGVKSDGYDQIRKRLSSSLMSFRSRVKDLISFIPGDMKNYTVHDISHLDALWELGDLIAGSDFPLNPAEAYVFGGAVLLHDAGMSVASYTNGLEYLRSTEQWNDSLAGTLRRRGGQADDEAQLSPEELVITITDTLRVLHAKKAKELALQSWEYPVGSGSQYLIEDSELRAHYGNTIGEIAYSHHWSTDDVVAKLSSSLGSFGGMPPEWDVDCVKVALLLRCADAAHIDHRRAPKLLFSLTRPTSISLQHWRFQNKLSKPILRNSKLIYTSTSPFSVDEAESWQLCYDTVRMIDKELSDSADILSDRKIKSFNSLGVLGSKSPKTLSEHVKATGWKPIATEIQVSDVPSLARTLGGYDLYSDDVVPIRELIQNAADAIDARLSIDDDFDQSDAKITVRIKNHEDEKNIIVEVEDNGIGMSEKTLTGALIDFGFSFWRSEAARNEFPGLQSKFGNPRGRYGIGFFSIFMWAKSVTVSSRKYREGMTDARVLEFSDGLGKRPLIRPAIEKEASNKFSTKISMTISKEKWESLRSTSELLSYVDEEMIYRTSQETRTYGRRQLGGRLLAPNINRTLSTLCGALLIPVVLESQGKSEVVNLPNWKTASTDDFLEFIEKVFPERMKRINKKFAQAESKITVDGNIVGRAFIEPVFEKSRARSIGALAYEGGIRVGYTGGEAVCGVIEARAENAARDKFTVHNIRENSEWLEAQKDYLSRICENIGEVIACQEALLRYGVFIEDKPLFLINRKTVSFRQLIEIVKKERAVNFYLEQASNGDDDVILFASSSVEGTTPFIGKRIDEAQIFFLVGIPGTIDNTTDEKSIVEQNNSPLAKVISGIAKAKPENRVITIKYIEKDGYDRRKRMFVEISDPPA